MRNSGTYLFGGVLGIIFGILIITHHNSWQNNWSTLITIVGWISLTKGIIALIFPQYLHSIGDIFMQPKNQKKLLLPILIIAGLCFGYFGFFLK